MKENDEFACSVLIIRKTYQGRLTVGIITFVVEFSESRSCAIPDRNHVIRNHIAKHEYVEHAKHIVEMKKSCIV